MSSQKIPSSPVYCPTSPAYCPTSSEAFPSSWYAPKLLHSFSLECEFEECHGVFTGSLQEGLANIFGPLLSTGVDFKIGFHYEGEYHFANPFNFVEYPIGGKGCDERESCNQIFQYFQDTPSGSPKSAYPPLELSWRLGRFSPGEADYGIKEGD